MYSFMDEQQVFKTARRMSFHALNKTISDHFYAAQHNSQYQDDLSNVLVTRANKLMDIFIQAAWERVPAPVNSFCGIKIEGVEEKISLEDYKKKLLSTLEQRQMPR